MNDNHPPLILIISEESDVSTSVLMDWVCHFGAKCVRVNTETEVQFKKLELDTSGTKSFSIIINNQEYSSNEFDSVWYRRGNFTFAIDYSFVHQISNEELKRNITNQIENEVLSLKRTIHDILDTKKHVGSYQKSNVDKLSVLLYAAELNINIPNSNIITNEQHLRSICLGNDRIAKAISNFNIITLPKDSKNQFGKAFGAYTEEISSKTNRSESFFPSLVQDKLEKIFEIRSFYLNGTFYSIAIFSQNDEQTSVDFRKYNYTKPNRVTRFKIPKETENKLNQLMQKLNLDSGSIDLIYTKDKKIVFLEVNPVGQFGMVSEPGNYYLEKKITEHLLNI